MLTYAFHVAGLSRTGTASFAQALAILLNGPVYHGGTQLLKSGDEAHIKTQMEILKRTPIKSAADRQFIMGGLRGLTDGYVAAVDAPFTAFLSELVELHPDALFICTIRDPDAWAVSMGALRDDSSMSLLKLMLFWIPCLRYFPRWVELFVVRWNELYSLPGETDPSHQAQWERHMQYVQRSIPKDRLVYYNVKDGWEPLCKALGCPVPSEPFPNVNDGKARNDFAKAQIAKGLWRWALAVTVGVICVGSGWQVWKSFA